MSTPAPSLGPMKQPFDCGPPNLMLADLDDTAYIFDGHRDVELYLGRSDGVRQWWIQPVEHIEATAVVSE